MNLLQDELQRILKDQSYYSADQKKRIDQKYRDQIKLLGKKIFVIDDDPTGIQTVHGIPLYTEWSSACIEQCFQEDSNLVFILTNSRAFSQEKTREVHRLIAGKIADYAHSSGKEYIIISRSDSTLRGHYPLETETIRETIESREEWEFDGELIVPYFSEGGRYTINNIHYVKENNNLVPAGETEFARDMTFAYKSSHLGQWCQEKTGGKYSSEDMIYLDLDDIRSENYQKMLALLMSSASFNKIIVNAVEDTDLKIVVIALLQTIKKGKNFLFRTAAPFPKILGGISDRPLLCKDDLITEKTGKGGIVLIGSHVQKTTAQLDYLLDSKKQFSFIEFNQHRFLEADGLVKEAEKVREKTEQAIKKGMTAVIYTRRERFELPGGSGEEQLGVAVSISAALTSIIKNLTVKPGFIISKGGITSSDVATDALNIKRAIVKGQIKPGVPVLVTGEESTFPDLPLVIFPGNVGEVATLREIAEMLMG